MYYQVPFLVTNLRMQRHFLERPDELLDEMHQFAMDMLQATQRTDSRGTSVSSRFVSLRQLLKRRPLPAANSTEQWLTACIFYTHRWPRPPPITSLLESYTSPHDHLLPPSPTYSPPESTFADPDSEGSLPEDLISDDSEPEDNHLD